MTRAQNNTDLSATTGELVDNHLEQNDPEPTAAEKLEWRRNDAFLPADDWDPDLCPAVRNTSAAFMFSGVVRPLEPTEPEYATIPLQPGMGDEENTKAAVAALPSLQGGASLPPITATKPSNQQRNAAGDQPC